MISLEGVPSSIQLFIQCGEREVRGVLPSGVLKVILGYCGVRELGTLTAVSKTFYKHLKEVKFWKELASRNYPQLSQYLEFLECHLENPYMEFLIAECICSI